MSPSAALIILAIALVLALLIAAETWLRRPKKPADPACTVDRALEHYTSHPELWAERDRRAIADLRAEEPSAALAASLHRTVETALAAEEPLVELRRAIMEATDRFVMEETLYRPEAGNEGRERLSPGSVAVAEAGVLRCYAMLRFADYAPEDWYTHYLRVAEMNARNVAAMLDQALSGEASTIEAALHEPMTRAMKEARDSLLRHPPQTPVRRSARLVAPQLPSRRSPDRRQIDRLTDLMSERFERLFAGQTVQLENGSLLSPAAALRVDAALLYVLLANEFRRPTEAWRRIIEEALGGPSETATNDHDELLAVGREAHRAWQRSQAGLDAALKAACSRLVPAASGAEGGEDAERCVDLLRDDASVLAREVLRVTRGEP